MPIKIHHGPPGSYKTSGAIADDLPKVVAEGRLLITNIRGLDDAEHIKEVLRKQKKPVNDDFRILHLDTAKEENRAYLRRFFHWAEKGAYFIIDEINTIYPRNLTERQLEKYNYPDDYEKDNRPPNVIEALEMHRHHNWDFVLTTPNYAKVHAIFKDVSEVAYKHVNKKTIGIGGAYWEYMHLADSTGRAKSDVIQIKTKKIKPWVFDLYKSTTTGEVSDTSAGANIFKATAFLLPIVGGIGLLGWGTWDLLNSSLYEDTQSPAEIIQAKGKTLVPETNTAVPSENSIHHPAAVNHPATGQTNHNDVKNPTLKPQGKTIISSTAVKRSEDPFLNQTIYITAVMKFEKFAEYHLEIGNSQKSRTITTSRLRRIGYRYTHIDQCFGYLQYKQEEKRLIMCKPTDHKAEIKTTGINLNPFSQENATE